MKNNVNLDKALAAIRNYPGARTDRKVFKIIAEYADGKGVATPTQKTISAATNIEQEEVSQSVHRLADKGFMTIHATMDDACYYHNTYQIAPPYLLDEAEAIADLSQRLDIVAIGVLSAEKAVYAQGPKISGNTERLEKLEKRLDDLARAIKKATNGNN